MCPSVCPSLSSNNEFLQHSKESWGVLGQAGKQASKQAGKHAGKHAGKQAGKQAGMQAFKQASKQALKGHSVGARPCRG